MRAFFPEGITLRRAGGFDKRDRRRKRRKEKGFTTEAGTRSTEDAEKKDQWSGDWVMGSCLPVIN